MIIYENDTTQYNIFRFLHSPIAEPEFLANVEIGILGLTKKPWLYERGKKTTRDYLDSDDNLVCQIRCEYIEDDLGHITNVNKFIDFYTNEGTVGMTKDVSKEYTSRELKKLNREVRQNQIDHLEAVGEEAPAVAPILNAIFDHYESDVDSYILRNGTGFEDAIRDEANPTITAYLNIVVEPAEVREDDIDLTIRGGILYQITGEYE